MADAPLALRRSVALPFQYLALSRRMAQYEGYDPHLAAIICSFASPTVCGDAQPGDGDDHALPFFQCARCSKVLCAMCRVSSYCTASCGGPITVCGKCYHAYYTCAGCDVWMGCCARHLHYSHVQLSGEPHSPLCWRCQQKYRCDTCDKMLCAVCPDHIVRIGEHSDAGLSLRCVPCEAGRKRAESKKRKAE